MVETMNTALQGCQPSGIRKLPPWPKRSRAACSSPLANRIFSTPDPIKEAAKTALDQNLTHYPPNAGEPYLLERVSQFEREKNGVEYSPQEIIVTDGATEGLCLALGGILNPGDEVIVPIPAFGLYEPLVKLSRGEYIPMDTCGDGFQITAQNLARHITAKTKAILLNSPNNPTGAVYTPESLKRSIRRRRRKTSLSFVTTCTHSWSMGLIKVFPGIRISGKKSSLSRAFPSRTHDRMA